jgi:sulfur-carrier protein
MSITIHIPAVLRACSAGARELSLSAASVRAALEQIERSHPALYRSVCDETGAVRRHVNLFVNTANVRDGDGLDTRMAPGDVLTIMPAVSGG